VAVKLLNVGASVGSEPLRVALNEMREGGRLNHERFVYVYDADPDEGWIISEYVAGGSLEQRISEKPQWVQDNFLRLAREIAEAAVVAHSQQLVHRDIKPANILLTEAGHVKIADFGLARRLAENELTATMAGSPAYMAPEVLGGEEYGVEVDLHSIGIVYYEMLAGVRPFSGGWSKLLLEKSNGIYPQLTATQSIPASVIRVVDQLLAVPEARLGSAEVLLAKLAQLDPSAAPGNSLDDMQSRLARIYGFRQGNKSPILCLVRLNAALQGLTGGLIHPVPDYAKRRAESYFPRVFAWICAASSSLNVRLSQLLWLKYDSECPYCRTSPCSCTAEDRVVGPDRNSKLLARMREKSIQMAPPSESFLQYYERLADIYAARDGEVSELCRHSFSEVAEAMDALIRLPTLRQLDEVVVLHLELADVVAWFMALLRAYVKQEKGYFFPREFEKYFSSGCYLCHEEPCACIETEPEIRMADWRPI